MPLDLIKVSKVFFDLVFIVILDRNNSGFLRGGVRGVPDFGIYGGGCFPSFKM